MIKCKMCALSPIFLQIWNHSSRRISAKTRLWVRGLMHPVNQLVDLAVTQSWDISGSETSGAVAALTYNWCISICVCIWVYVKERARKSRECVLFHICDWKLIYTATRLKVQHAILRVKWQLVQQIQTSLLEDGKMNVPKPRELEEQDLEEPEITVHY